MWRAGRYQRLLYSGTRGGLLDDVLDFMSVNPGSRSISQSYMGRNLQNLEDRLPLAAPNGMQERLINGCWRALSKSWARNALGEVNAFVRYEAMPKDAVYIIERQIVMQNPRAWLNERFLSGVR